MKGFDLLLNYIGLGTFHSHCQIHETTVCTDMVQYITPFTSI